MDRINLSTLITDLDNTLYDWVHIWYSSFLPMIDALLEIGQFDREVLLDDVRSVHQAKGNSEYAFLIEELKCVRQKYNTDQEILSTSQPAIDAYRAGRRRSLRLYAGVADTLRLLKRNGVTIVGYTESKAFYTGYRVRRLGLDGLIDYLYSPLDDDVPEGVDVRSLRFYEDGHYTFFHTVHRHTPKGELKPNPAILRTIMHETGASVSSTIYVGDSLFKDVPMAQDCGVLDVFAEYGKAQHREEYDLLRRVTHWTDMDVGARTRSV